MEKIIDPLLQSRTQKHTPTTNKSQKTSSAPNKITLTVENIVASVNVNAFIDLSALLERYKDIEKKENFPGAIVKLIKPRATILIFSSGKLVITGVKLVKYISIIVEKTIRKLKEAGMEIHEEPTVSIENIVCRADFGCAINLDMTSLSLNSAIYEPEVFPGLIYKIVDPYKICFLIFSSGKVICTGAKDLDIIKSATKDLALDLKRNKVLGREKEKIEKKLDLDLLDLL